MNPFRLGERHRTGPLGRPAGRAIASLVACASLAVGLAGDARAFEPPPRPDAPSVERVGAAVRLTWTGIAEARRYRVYRGSRVIGMTRGLSFLDDAPRAGEPYSVTACRGRACSIGSPGVAAPGAAVVVRPLHPPAPPGPVPDAELVACEIDRTALTLERDELLVEIGELLAAAVDAAGDAADEATDAKGGSGAAAPVDVAETFACLDAAPDVVSVVGSHARKYTVDGSPGRAWDARGFDALTDGIRHGTVVMREGAESPGMCWAGGYVRSTRAVDASWAEHKANDDPDDPSRNSAAISNASVGGIVTGMHVANVADAFRNYETQDWLVQHSWAEYVRDDAIENDDLRRGRVHDVLLDGVYSGFSARPASLDDEVEADGNVVTLERVLLRMEAQPYPYQWRERGGNINADGEPWREGDGVPYGHGNVFKIEDHDVPGRNVRWALRDLTLMATHRIGDARKLDFPPDELLEDCSGVTVIWTGGGHYPGELPGEKFPDCVSVVTGEAGRALWAERVDDWHRRHPDVGIARKREAPGRIEWPRRSAVPD